MIKYDNSVQNVINSEENKKLPANTKEYFKYLSNHKTVPKTMQALVNAFKGAFGNIDKDNLQTLKFSVFGVTFSKIEQLFQKDKRDKADLTPIFEALSLFLDKEADKRNFSSEHKQMVEILRVLEKMHMRVSEDIQAKAVKFLHFDHLADNVNIVSDLLVCAKAGLNIKQAVIQWINSNSKGWFKHFNEISTDIDGIAIAKVIDACLIHDANVTDEKQKIPKEIIQALFKAASKTLNGKSASDAAFKTFFSNDVRYDRGVVEDTNPATRLLRAMEFYKSYGVDASNLNYLLTLLKFNNVGYNKSKPQEVLEKYLSKNLQGQNYQVLDEQVLSHDHSVDIVVKPPKGQSILVQFDGKQFHKLRDAKFDFTDESLYQDRARDVVAKKAGYEIYRFTVDDFSFNRKNGYIYSASKDFRNFLTKMEVPKYALPRLKEDNSKPQIEQAKSTNNSGLNANVSFYTSSHKSSYNQPKASNSVAKKWMVKESVKVDESKATPTTQIDVKTHKSSSVVNCGYQNREKRPTRQFYRPKQQNNDTTRVLGNRNVSNQTGQYNGTTPTMRAPRSAFYKRVEKSEARPNQVSTSSLVYRRVQS